MPIIFEKYDWLLVKDLERCPYPIFNAEYAERQARWCRDDDRRMLLIALDRYADFITPERNKMGKQKLLEFLVAIINAHGSMITTDEAIKAICEEIDKYMVVERV